MAGPQPRSRRPRNPAASFVLAGAGVLALLALAAALMTNPFSPRVDPEAVPDTGPAAGEGPIGPAELAAGQCFAAYESAWQSSFRLAECAQPHAAELYAIVPAAPAGAPYPGEQALAAEAQRACQAPAALDLAAAAAVEGLRLEASYPLSQAEWDAGDTDYLCFAFRDGGAPLEGSLRPAA